MSNRKQGWTFAQVPIWAICDPRISDGAKTLLAYLVWRQGENPDAWPSVQRMADDLRVSKSTVSRRIEELDAVGYTHITYRPGQSSLYAMVADPDNASHQYTPGAAAAEAPMSEVTPVAATPPMSEVTWVQEEPMSKVTCHPCQKRHGTHVKSDMQNDRTEQETQNDSSGANAPDDSESDTFTDLFPENPPPPPQPDPTPADLSPQEKYRRRAERAHDGWVARLSEDPWAMWGGSGIRTRDGVSADALRRVGWLIEHETGLKPVDGELTGWVKGLAMVYNVGAGDWDAIQAGIRAAWARDPTYRPTHARGFVGEVRKALVLQAEEKARYPRQLHLTDEERARLYAALDERTQLRDTPETIDGGRNPA